MITTTLIGLGVAAAAVWLALAALVIAVRIPGQSVAQAVRVLPDSVRLAFALLRDRTLPRSVRWRLRIALLYNLQPINLIPDVLPVIGFADNIAVLAWALRGAVRNVGPDVVGHHWRGSPDSLAAFYRVLRLSGPVAGLGPPGREPA